MGQRRHLVLQREANRVECPCSEYEDHGHPSRGRNEHGHAIAPQPSCSSVVSRPPPGGVNSSTTLTIPPTLRRQPAAPLDAPPPEGGGRLLSARSMRVLPRTTLTTTGAPASRSPQTAYGARTQRNVIVRPPAVTGEAMALSLCSLQCPSSLAHDAHWCQVTSGHPGSHPSCRAHSPRGPPQITCP